MRFLSCRTNRAGGSGSLRLAVCCASAQNHIKTHESEFLYHANCIRSPKIEDFLHIYAKKTTSATGLQVIPLRADLRSEHSHASLRHSLTALAADLRSDAAQSPYPDRQTISHTAETVTVPKLQLLEQLPCI
jgi:hypothetical protein